MLGTYSVECSNLLVFVLNGSGTYYRDFIGIVIVCLLYISMKVMTCRLPPVHAGLMGPIESLEISCLGYEVLVFD